MDQFIELLREILGKKDLYIDFRQGGYVTPRLHRGSTNPASEFDGAEGGKLVVRRGAFLKDEEFRLSDYLENDRISHAESVAEAKAGQESRSR